MVKGTYSLLLMGRMAGSTIIDIAYGLEILTSDDPYLKRAEECLQIIVQAGNPGSYLVDILPACAPHHSSLPAFFNLLSLVKYVPEWMPGASFKRKARVWRSAAERVYTIPFDYVKQSMADGTAKPSFTTLALRDITEDDDRDYQEELIKALGGTMYTGVCQVANVLWCEPSEVVGLSWGRYGTDPTHMCVRTVLTGTVLVDRLDPPDFLPRDVDAPGRTKSGPRRD
jgi:hypothetical protein